MSAPLPYGAPPFLEVAREVEIGGWRWLILVDPHLPGEENMRRDWSLLGWAASEPEAKPVLRFFLWNPPAISIGYNQSAEDIDEAKCRREGIDIVRRPTGGRAILHHDEFTYSVTLPPSHPLARLPVVQTCNVISLCLVRGLRRLGINATLAKKERGNLLRNPSCFSSAARYELLANGKKLVGSAQRRVKGAVLQQGSVLVGQQYRRLADFVRGRGDEIRRQLEEHSTCIAELVNTRPSYSDFVEATTEGFIEQLSNL